MHCRSGSSSATATPGASAWSTLTPRAACGSPPAPAVDATQARRRPPPGGPSSSCAPARTSCWRRWPRARAPCVALFIDYGPAEPSFGDTLQAVRGHAYTDPLAEPGTADLTAHVQFAALGGEGTRRRPGGRWAHDPGGVSGPARHRRAHGKADGGQPGARRRDRGRRAAAAVARPAWAQLFKVVAVRSPALPRAAALRLGAASPCQKTSPAARIAEPCPACQASRTASSPATAASREGIYASLNCGVGSKDDPAGGAGEPGARRRASGRRASSCRAYQVHGTTALVVDEAWPPASARKADAMVTATPGLALGVLTADCAPVLFADASSRGRCRGPCRLARRLDRRRRGHDRRPWRAWAQSGERIWPPSAPASAKAPTRWGRNSRPSFSLRMPPAHAFSRRHARGRARTSICPATSPIACGRRASGDAGGLEVPAPMLRARISSATVGRARERSPTTAGKYPPSS